MQSKTGRILGYRPWFDIRMSNVLKGIAIILMFVHHFFTFPEWYTGSISYPELTGFAALFQQPTRLCVPIFAFVTGYTYRYKEHREQRYSLRKITDLLAHYWLVMVILYLVALLTGTLTLSLKGTVLEALGLHTPVMYFCWYVPFYCLTMLWLPLVKELTPDSPWKRGIVGLVLPIAVTRTVGMLTGLSAIDDVSVSFSLNWPTVVMGAAFAETHGFERMNAAFNRWVRSYRLRPLLCWIVMIAAFMARYFVQLVTLGQVEIRGLETPLAVNLEFLWIPFFLWAVIRLFSAAQRGPIRKGLESLGRHSEVMWLLHCAFFNVSAAVTQPLLYWPGNPLLVLGWGLLLCWSLAVALDWAMRPLLRAKNRLLGVGKKRSQHNEV